MVNRLLSQVAFFLLLTLVASCGDKGNNFQSADEPQFAVSVGFIQLRMPPDENRTQAQDSLRLQNNGDGDLTISSFEWIDKPDRLEALGERAETGSCAEDADCSDGQICITASQTCVDVGLPATPLTIEPQLAREIDFVVERGGSEMVCPEPPADVPSEFFETYCGVLRIETNAINDGEFVEDGQALVYFLNTGASGQINVDPNFLEFANVQPGTTHQQEFSIQNTGVQDLRIDSITVEDNPDLFTITGLTVPIGGVVESGTAATFEVVVTIPEDAENYEVFTNLVIQSSAGRTNVAVEISADAGSSPFIELSETVLRFDAADRQTLTIENTGAATLAIRGVDTNPEARPFYRFEIDGNDVTDDFQTVNVSAGNSVELDVIFSRPAGNEDPSIGTLEIAHNDPNHGFKSELTLLGDEGDVPIGRIHPIAFTFLAADGNSESRDFVIRNVGTAPLNLNAVAWNFSNGSDAEFQITGADGTVEPGGIQRATVTFTGMNATPDVGLALLDSNNLVDLSLTLRALQSASEQPQPVITVTNQGALRTSAPVNLSAAESMPAGVANNAIWTTLARPSGSTVFLDGVGETASFTPDVAGTYTVALTLLNSSGDREAQATVELEVE